MTQHDDRALSDAMESMRSRRIYVDINELFMRADDTRSTGMLVDGDGWEAVEASVYLDGRLRLVLCPVMRNGLPNLDDQDVAIVDDVPGRWADEVLAPAISAYVQDLGL